MNVTNTYPNAPDSWSVETAKRVANEEGLDLQDDHWEVVRSIQEYFAKTDFFKSRQLLDALDEHFHAKGGLKYLYTLLPKGPVAQGCRLAGIHPPAGSIDESFGSVQ